MGTDPGAQAAVDLTPYDALDLGVSRRHVKLYPSGANVFVVDLGSTNGTQINGEPLKENQLRKLANGDLLSLGKLEMVVRVIQGPAAHVEGLRHQADLADALAVLAKAITSRLDLDAVLDQALGMAMSLTSAREAAIWLVDAQTQELFLEAERGIQDESVRRMRLPVTDRLVSKVIQTGAPLSASREVSGEEVKVRTGYTVEALLYVPLVHGDETLGVLAAAHRDPGKVFGPRDEKLLSAVADFAAIAIQNTWLYKQLETYSASLEEAVRERTTELQRVKDRVEVILNNSPDAILLLRADGTIRTCNRAFYKMFRYQVDEVYNQPPVTLVEAGHVEAIGEALRAVMREGRPQRLEAVARCKGGETFDADVALAPILTEGAVTDIVCSIRDISALKEAERMKDAFVSNVSHELRSPITSLKLAKDMIEASLADPQRALGWLAREIDRLEHIIEDLLQLSRLDQGRVAFTLAPVDLNQLAEEYVEDRAPLAESRALSLTHDLMADLPPVQADRGLLGQVLSIFLTNAINYTPEGGQIVVRTHARRVDEALEAGFSVSDTGPGVSAEDKKQLFTRFYRGEAGRASMAAGTGLGLSIAKEIVERHRGQIGVVSEGLPGKGATFTVWLPVDS